MGPHREAFHSSRNGVPGASADFFITRRGQKRTPTGSQFEIFLFYVDEEYLSRELFFDFKITLLGWHFFSEIFYPRCGSYEMLPYGVPFDSLSFLYLTSGHFFDFKITLLGWYFMNPEIF